MKNFLGSDLLWLNPTGFVNGSFHRNFKKQVLANTLQVFPYVSLQKNNSFIMYILVFMKAVCDSHEKS